MWRLHAAFFPSGWRKVSGGHKYILQARRTSGGLSLKCTWLGHADLCRGPMDTCQLYQSLCRAPVRQNIFETDLARRNVLGYSMANQNQSRKLTLQSTVLNITFLSLTCSSHKEKLKLEKLGVWVVFV